MHLAKNGLLEAVGGAGELILTAEEQLVLWAEMTFLREGMGGELTCTPEELVLWAEMASLREWRRTNLYTRGAGALGRDDLLEGVEEF